MSGSLSMDRFDRHIVEFVLKWAPYGWPPENETFIEFGLHAEELQKRFWSILRAMRTQVRSLDNFDRNLLARACTFGPSSCHPSLGPADQRHDAAS